MSSHTEFKETIVIHTMELAREIGWKFLTLRDIAERSEVSLADLRDVFEDKEAILSALGRMIDRKVLENISLPDINVSHRDQLFDVMMERFDALNEYRAGVVSVFHAVKFDPKQAVIAAPHLCRSMNWMLEAAGVDTSGVKGAARVAGLMAVYLKCIRIWVQDDSSDMGKTMAELDKNLCMVEKYAGILKF